MTSMQFPGLSRTGRLGLGAAALLALGAAAGAGAVSLSRPAIQMAPTVRTAIASLPASNGIVTIRGRVAAVYGDRFIVQDATGRAMIDAGRAGRGSLAAGAPILVQGRFDDGQLRAAYLVDGNGRIETAGPGAGSDGPRPGPGPHERARDDMPPPPPPPPVGPGCDIARSGAVARSPLPPVARAPAPVSSGVAGPNGAT